MGAATGSIAGGAKVTIGNSHATFEDDAKLDTKGTEVNSKVTEVKYDGDGRRPRLEWWTLRPKRNNSTQGATVLILYQVCNNIGARKPRIEKSNLNARQH